MTDYKKLIEQMRGDADEEYTCEYWIECSKRGADAIEALQARVAQAEAMVETWHTRAEAHRAAKEASDAALAAERERATRLLDDYQSAITACDALTREVQNFKDTLAAEQEQRKHAEQSRDRHRHDHIEAIKRATAEIMRREQVEAALTHANSLLSRETTLLTAEREAHERTKELLAAAQSLVAAATREGVLAVALDEAEKAKAALARADALVRSVEWSATTITHEAGRNVLASACPRCGRMQHNGHNEVCELAAYLRDREGGAHECAGPVDCPTCAAVGSGVSPKGGEADYEQEKAKMNGADRAAWLARVKGMTREERIKWLAVAHVVMSGSVGLDAFNEAEQRALDLIAALERSAFRAGFMATVPYGEGPWAFDGPSAADREPEAWQAWLTLRAEAQP